MEPSRFEKHARMWIEAINNNKNDQQFHKDVANYIRNFIFDAGQRSTGFASREALKIKANQRCKEHFHSRLAIGQSIVGKILNGRYDHNPRSYRRMYLEIFSACRVHNCTPEENRRLQTIQNDPATKHLPWRKQYKIAGVKLVYTGSTYIIDKIRYIGWTEADLAEMLGMSIYKFRKYHIKKSLV